MDENTFKLQSNIDAWYHLKLITPNYLYKKMQKNPVNLDFCLYFYISNFYNNAGKRRSTRMNNVLLSDNILYAFATWSFR
ncbi:unnamed protein product [Rhizophagus irregularis]|nr:unnamed protein product [Rhizophagus irregularis]